MSNELRTIHEQRRGCGFRKEGGLYLVSEGAPNGVLPRFVIIEPPIPYDGQHFRGYVYVDGDMLQQREDKAAWWIGPSLDRAIQREWSQLLGMPLATRKRLGICAGAKDAEEVIQRLSDLSWLVEPTSRSYQACAQSIFAGVSALGLGETPAAAAAVDLLHRTAMLHLSPTDVLARCWIIADLAFRNGYTAEHEQLRDDLARVMVMVNAIQDAGALTSDKWLAIWKKPQFV